MLDQISAANVLSKLDLKSDNQLDQKKTIFKTHEEILYEKKSRMNSFGGYGTDANGFY